MLVFWMTAQPWDPVAGAAASVRATSCDLAPCVIINGLEWLPVLAEGPTFSTSTFDGAAVGPVDATRGEITFAAAFGEIDNWAGLVWGDRPIQIYYAAIDVTNPAAPVFPTWAGLTKIFDGVVESYDPDRASLSLSSVLPAGKVASATYTGGGGANGAANIAGTVKPWASGRHLNRPAVLVDPATQLYQVHGYGPIQELTTIREAGTVLDQARVNYATAALLIAASIPATTIGTCLAEGMFRLGFTPVGTISADFKGDNGGGTFSARPGVVIKRLLTATGWSTSKIAQDSLDDLDTSVPYDVWCYDDSGADVLDLITEIVQPLGGYWDVDELGTFYVGLFRKKVGPDFSVGDPGLAVDYDLFSVDQLPTRAPFWRNRIGYAYNPNVYSPTELNIADSIADTAASIPAGNANRVRFSQFEADTLGWALNWNPNGIAAGGPLTNNLPPFKYVRQTAIATAANQRYALGIASAYRIPVTAGERLSVQAKFAGIGAVASTTAYIFFVDTAGAAVGSGATIGSATGTRPYASGDWFNAAAFVDVPTGAVLAYIEIHNVSSGAGLMTADLTRVMVTQASAGQTVHPSFTPGPNSADGADVTAVNAALGTNLAVNSELLNTAAGWKPGWNGDIGGTINRGYNLFDGATYYYKQTNVLWAARVGTPVAGKVFDCFTTDVAGGNIESFARYATPVLPGERYYFSWLVSAHRGTASAIIGWYGADGNQLAFPNNEFVAPSITNNYGAVNGDPTSFFRSGAFVTVPANARYACIWVRMAADGAADPFVFVTQPFIAKVSASQAVIPPYTPGPADRQADRTSDNTAANTSNVGSQTAGTVNTGVTTATNAANSDGTIKGDKVVTDSIAARAATDAATATAGAGTLTTGGTVDGVSVTYNVVAGKVRVDICTDAYRSAGSGHIAYVQIIRTKGGVDTQLGRNFPVLGFTGDFTPTVYWVIDEPGAGSVTYKVRYTRDSGTGTLAYNNQAIAVTEFKDQS